MKLNFLLTILLTFMSFILFSQEKIKHEKRIFINEEDKMFIQKDLPVYIYISTSKDSTKKILLKSKKTREYTNPMYFDSEGYNTIRSPWAVDNKSKKIVIPKTDIIFDIYSDSKPPITKIEFKGKFINKNDTIILSKDTDIILKSKDELSGVQNIYYSINNENYKEYQNNLNLIDENKYILKYYSVDNVGNVESIKIINIIIDNSPPKSILKYKGDVYKKIISNESFLIIESSDNIEIKKTFFSINDSEFFEYNNKILASNLKEGEHIIKYYSIDNIENKENIKIDTFFIDKTAPIIIQDIIGNEYLTSNGEKYSSGESKLKLTAFDNKSGIKEIYYSVNNEKFKKYEKPINLSFVSGEINLKTYAIDNVNNKTNSKQKEKIIKNIPYIDLTPPNLSYSFEKPIFKTKKDIFISKNTKIYLKGKDSESGINNIKFKINNNYNLYENPFTIKEEGNYEIKYKGFDNVDNVNTEKFNVIVDNTAPDIFIKFSIDPIDEIQIENKIVKIYQPHVVIFFSSYDKFSGFEKIIYSINNGEKKIYNDKIYNLTPNKYYEIEIEVFDKLENSKIKKIYFFISE